LLRTFPCFYSLFTNPKSNRSRGIIPEPHLTVLVPEMGDEISDHDSTLEDSPFAISTTSIGSSILKYREENGRTYHVYKDGIYLKPNDDVEKDRLDLQHHLFNLTLGEKLFICPVAEKRRIHRVLDVGTGLESGQLTSPMSTLKQRFLVWISAQSSQNLSHQTSSLRSMTPKTPGLSLTSLTSFITGLWKAHSPIGPDSSSRASSKFSTAFPL